MVINSNHYTEIHPIQQKQHIMNTFDPTFQYAKPMKPKGYDENLDKKVLKN